ncbi:hypothetical protein dsx2_1138 [Desulfovibrio sp. X2]|uniref:WcbI family polysaccharide biosynthesis putative acetyltransferase n=1 Tax=Desulfovibrio sp. X2 TaxID=941449 RepID=UPI0003588C0C|nr:WcbI family polysaccharide biosynthesis putative acetyltransferase [Desulfovibrio sp. X2]EPR37195.1 hypothetical protein dsx2_1138 [Desulfovibrio sp. X2]
MDSIFIFATCQGLEIANILRLSPTFSRLFEIRSQFNFLAPGEASDPRRFLDEIAGSRFFFYQRNEFLDDAFLASLPLTLRASPIPYVTSKIYWPSMLDQNTEPRLLCCEQNPYGYIPFRCGVLEEMIDSGWDDERIVSRYTAARLDELLDLDEHFERQIGHLRKLDGSCDIKVADFVESRVRETMLFHIFNHPAIPVMRHMADGMLDLLGLPLDLPRDVPDKFVHSQLPVHPSVARAYGLAFAAEDRIWNLGPRKVNFEEYLRLYISDYRRVVTPAASPRPIAARRLAEAAPVP